MEYIDMIVKQIINNFDFAFMFTVNVLTYLLIKFVDMVNGVREVTTWQKRIILLLCLILVTIAYKVTGYASDIILFNSAILAPVFWDWILRPILVKFNIGYKNIDDTFH